MEQEREKKQEEGKSRLHPLKELWEEISWDIPFARTIALVFRKKEGGEKLKNPLLHSIVRGVVVIIILGLCFFWGCEHGEKGKRASEEAKKDAERELLKRRNEADAMRTNMAELGNEISRLLNVDLRWRPLAAWGWDLFKRKEYSKSKEFFLLAFDNDASGFQRGQFWSVYSTACLLENPSAEACKQFEINLGQIVSEIRQARASLSITNTWRTSRGFLQNNAIPYFIAITNLVPKSEYGFVTKQIAELDDLQRIATDK